MATWKYWDVAIAVVGFLIQCGLAWLGLTLTHWKHKAAFFGLVILGVVFTGIAVKRGIESAEKVQTQLNTIQQNTEKPQPVPVVNVQMPTSPNHTVVAWDDPRTLPQPPVPLLPFRKDEEPALNMGYSNAGNFTVLSAKQQGKLIVLPYHAELAEVFKKHENEILKEPSHPSGVVVPHDPGHAYWTYVGQKLSDQDVADLNRGAKMLCGIAVVTWTDTTGMYRTHFNQCFYEQIGGTFNWHLGAEHNREEKLR